MLVILVAVDPSELRVRGIDIADPRDDRVLVRADADATLVGVFDGASSWGFGVDAARWARERMRLLWEAPSELRPATIVDDLLSLVDEVPPPWRGEHGWSFALMVGLVRGRAVTLVSAGLYAATLVGAAGDTALQAPIVEARTLADTLVAAGTVSIEGAEEVPDVCLGPYFGDDEADVRAALVPVELTLAREQRLVIARYDVLRLVAGELATFAERGAAAIRDEGIAERRGSGPVLVVG